MTEDVKSQAKVTLQVDSAWVNDVLSDIVAEMIYSLKYVTCREMDTEIAK